MEKTGHSDIDGREIRVGDMVSYDDPYHEGVRITGRVIRYSTKKFDGYAVMSEHFIEEHAFKLHPVIEKSKGE